jgi:hypothetical protein
VKLNDYIDLAKAVAGKTPIQETVQPQGGSEQATVGLSICERLKERKPEDVKPIQMTPAWAVPA